MNRTEQIFYFRTYTKYIVTIQYILYICHVWYMLHSDNSYACLRDNNSVCIFFIFYVLFVFQQVLYEKCLKRQSFTTH